MVFADLSGFLAGILVALIGLLNLVFVLVA
jgi:hypothetical protein